MNTPTLSKTLKNIIGGETSMSPATTPPSTLPLPGQRAGPATSSVESPDVWVVLGQRDDYTDHPTTAPLIVEVADISLTNDRMIKSRLYATVNIPEYWIVNLIDRMLERHRQPSPGGYADVVALPPTATITTTQGVMLTVADLFA